MRKRSLSLFICLIFQLAGLRALSQCTPPAEPAASNTITCSGATALLSATGAGTLGWYDAPNAGNWLGAGASFTTPMLTSTITYYVQDSTCAASATRKAVIVTVNPSPVAGLTVFPALICTGTSVKFNATSSCGANPAVAFSGSSAASRSLISNARDNITLEIWAKWSGAFVGDNQILFYNGHTGNGGYGILMRPSGNFQILAGGLAYLGSSANATPGIWQHIAIVRNNGTWSLYLDGTQYSVSSNTLNPNAPNATGGNQVSIGYAQNGGQRYFGELDEAKFWTVARNTSEIQSDMTSCITGPTTNLLAYWGFNEGTGTSVADGSGNGLSLSLNNTSWISSGAPTGVVTYAWDFGDGTNATAKGNVHVYSSSGTKNVSLIVTGTNTCTASISSPVVVNQSPTVSITGNATNCNAVTLTAAGDGTYSWSGGTSTNTAVNSFVSSGTYSVTVTNAAGCTAVTSRSVTVNAFPAAPVKGALPTLSDFTSSVGSPRGLAFDTNGNLFVSNQDDEYINKVTPDGTVSVFQTGVSSPEGVYVDLSDNVYVNSYGDVKKIAPDGTVMATYTGFNGAFGLQVTSAGIIYVAEMYTGAIKKIDGGVVSTFASGLSNPAGIAFDGSGNLYVSEQINSGTIRKISSTGVVTTFATGLTYPYGLAFDTSGNLYVAERYNTRAIIRITPGGVKTTYITLANNPQYLTFTSSGNLYVSNDYLISKIVPAILNVTTVIDSGSVTLIATPAAGITVDWFSQAAGGTLLLASNTNYTTPVVRSTTNYYAESRNTTTGCIAATRTIVPVTVIYNTLNKYGKISVDDSNKINRNGAPGGAGVTKNGKVIN